MPSHEEQLNLINKLQRTVLKTNDMQLRSTLKYLQLATNTNYLTDPALRKIAHRLEATISTRLAHLEQKLY